MQILICHLTRMQPGYICVAGIEMEARNPIRPHIRGQKLQRSHLVRHGGLFDMASIVDLGPVVNIGRAPEVEDRRFDLARARRIGDMEAGEFWQILLAAARPTLHSLFGPAFQYRGNKGVIEANQGQASLGCLIPIAPLLYVDRYDKIRMRLLDGDHWLDLSVTDLRLCEEDHVTPRRQVIQQVGRRIQQGVKPVLAVGLTRPWSKEDEGIPRHWLQVNNIHLEDDPRWAERSA